ncbi:hypothetical protein ACFQAT_02340 [Undibacterium arcticum]|uniref:Uncharacterized protein n=1 Tax=Undibacterium arcticum TaxID=1762892 RepID=A0ABV7EYR6_9BURK
MKATGRRAEFIALKASVFEQNLISNVQTQQDDAGHTWQPNLGLHRGYRSDDRREEAKQNHENSASMLNDADFCAGAAKNPGNN